MQPDCVGLYICKVLDRYSYHSIASYVLVYAYMHSLVLIYIIYISLDLLFLHFLKWQEFAKELIASCYLLLTPGQIANWVSA